MSVSTLYSTSATANGGRDGKARSDDGRLEVSLDTPKAMGGNDGPGTNPEQLFAAGYSACFLGALKFVTSQKKGVAFPADASTKATVGIGPRSEGGFGLTIALDITLPGLDRAEAQALVDEAHQVCPYSNATRGNIDVQLTLT